MEAGDKSRLASCHRRPNAADRQPIAARISAFVERVLPVLLAEYMDVSGVRQSRFKSLRAPTLAPSFANQQIFLDSPPRIAMKRTLSRVDFRAVRGANP